MDVAWLRFGGIEDLGSVDVDVCCHHFILQTVNGMKHIGGLPVRCRRKRHRSSGLKHAGNRLHRDSKGFEACSCHVSTAEWRLSSMMCMYIGRLSMKVEAGRGEGSVSQWVSGLVGEQLILSFVSPER